MLCFFGDGASCEGEFFEAMNMAMLWKVPLVFICENNGIAISVPTSKSQATPDIADRARGFGMPAAIVDGNDVIAVRDAVAEGVERHGPAEARPSSSARPCAGSGTLPSRPEAATRPSSGAPGSGRPDPAFPQRARRVGRRDRRQISTTSTQSRSSRDASCPRGGGARAARRRPSRSTRTSLRRSGALAARRPSRRDRERRRGRAAAAGASMREVADGPAWRCRRCRACSRAIPDVSPAMSEKVMEAVAELDYQPDILAQSLRRRETLSVGFVVGDISNPLFAGDRRSASSRRSSTNGYSMLLTNSLGDPLLEAAHIAAALAPARGRARDLGARRDPSRGARQAARPRHPRRRARPQPAARHPRQPGSSPTIAPA